MLVLSKLSKYSAFKILALLILLFFETRPVYAFKLSPCLRVLTQTDGQLGQEKIRWFNFCGFLPDQYKSAVHEHMTLAAIRQYRGDGILQVNERGWKYQYMTDGVWDDAGYVDTDQLKAFLKDKEKNQLIKAEDFPSSGRMHQTHSIIYGTWWNDEPLMLTWGQGIGFICGAGGVRKLSRSDHKDYIGSTSRCKVPNEFHLGRASHYGDLQHLHFMTTLPGNCSSADDRVYETTNKALNWLQFAYSVATGNLDPETHIDATMENMLSLPPVYKNACQPEEEVKVLTLFTRIGWNYEDRKTVTPDIALGTMFHVIQDSFSTSHTCRVEQDSEDGLSKIAALQDVWNYAEQVSVAGGEKMHGDQDLYPQWLTDKIVHGEYKYSNDPIAVGAWLLSAVSQNKPWSEVEEYLRSTIFAQADPKKTSGNPCLFVEEKFTE